MNDSDYEDSSLSVISRLSTRKSVRQKRKTAPRFEEWCLFHFYDDHALLTVPSSWITTVTRCTESNGNLKVNYICWWPRKGSAEEENVRFLIRNISQPTDDGQQLPGFLIGTFDSYEESEKALARREGTVATTDDERVNVDDDETQNILQIDSVMVDSLITDTLQNTGSLLKRDTDMGSARSSPRKNKTHTQSVQRNAKDIITPSSLHEKLDHMTGLLEKLMGEMKNISSRQEILEKKLTSSTPGHYVKAGLYESPSSPMKDDCGKPMTNTIEKMASSKECIRSQVNSLRCLQDLGLPISSCTNELKQFNHMLDGEDANSVRRRNALANALGAVIPPSDKRTVIGVIRAALYAIAPAFLWQFYSGQGLAGSPKTSFVDELPHVYKAVLVAAVQTTKVDQPSVVKGISEVLKSLHTRKDSIKYYNENPEEVKKHLGPIGKFSKKGVLKQVLQQNTEFDTQLTDIDNDDIVDLSS